MDLRVEDRELEDVVRRHVGASHVVARKVLWQWALSRVERVALGGDRSVILKRSRTPLTDEGRIIDHLSGGRVPLPTLLFAHSDGNILTLLMEDLGPSSRPPTLTEAAMAAVQTHAAPPPPGLVVLDQGGLRGLPSSALDSLDYLEDEGRWQDTQPLRDSLIQISRMAPKLSRDATMPPFGLCHSEFHPTSLHVGTRKTALVDWARAFVGPGLLDIASYAGTDSAPDPIACRLLLDAYVAAGGAGEAGSGRAGLPAAYWALFWHRVWVVEWFLKSCATWMTDPRQDMVYRPVVERHVREAFSLLEGRTVL